MSVNDRDCRCGRETAPDAAGRQLAEMHTVNDALRRQLAAYRAQSDNSIEVDQIWSAGKPTAAGKSRMCWPDSKQDLYSDPDDDNGINREEWVAHFGDDVRFDAHDVDNDGLVSRAEFLAAFRSKKGPDLADSDATRSQSGDWAPLVCGLRAL